MVRKIRKKVTKNYVSWCQFVGKKHNLRCVLSCTFSNTVYHMTMFASQVFVATSKATVLYALKRTDAFQTLNVEVMWKSIT